MQKAFIYLLFIFISASINAQYISRILEYVPAPGQHINTTLGSPYAAESIIGGLNGLLSLGAFGGYVVFSFEQPVENDPANPYGIDFSIFGNPMPFWAEHGIVSVMKDENGNGLPDDTWYELAGSDYFFSSTMHDYEVTYRNPGNSDVADIPWTDNQSDSGFVQAVSFTSRVMYPLQDSFPMIDAAQYSLSGTFLPDPVNRNNPAQMVSPVRPFGYADSRTRGTAPFTLPDNPYTPEIENSGGDAFDIGWAVSDGGEYVDLDEIHFVKVQTAVLSNAAWLGELSTDIAGAVDIPPAEEDGLLDIIVIERLPDTIRGSSYQLSAFAFHMGRRQPEAEIDWSTNLPYAQVSEDNILSFSASGQLTLTATLATNSSVQESVQVELEFDDGTSAHAPVETGGISVFPNPAREYIAIEGMRNGDLQIFNTGGRLVLMQTSITEGERVYIGNLVPGLYVVKVGNDNEINYTKLLVK